MVNLFGANGYIGSCYQTRHAARCQARNDLVPVTDRVLYMISTTHNHHLKTNPWIDVDTNIVTLLRVLENCRNVGVTEFNFVSSWFVYGPVQQAVTEDAACRPQGFYSITKHTAEQLLMEYCQTHGITWRIMRLCNVLGGADTGASVHKNAVDTVIRRVLQGDILELVQGGRFLRDYLHVHDVCDAIHHVINQGTANTIYNIGTGQPVMFVDVVEYILDVMDRTVVISNNTASVIDCVLNCSRLQSLGWQPTIPWQDAVREMIAGHQIALR